jgi:predicted enzyme related to lactoylglutathione lyase
MLSNNISVSRLKDCLRLSSNSFADVSTFDSSRRFSHWPAKLLMIAARLRVRQHSPDPLPAHFRIAQAKAHIGARLVGENGAFGWDELWTTDRKKAAQFYQGLFGWAAKEGNMGDMGVYVEWQNGGQSIGGIMEITPDMGPVPPNWLPYFMVDNRDAVAEKATKSGAKLMVPPQDIPNIGKFCVITDPQGAAFAIIKIARPPQ